MKQKINFQKFLEISELLEIKIGKIISVEEVPKSKLLKLTVDFGDETRISLTNIGDKLPAPMINLPGKYLPFITNLEPVVMKGIETTAMIVVGTANDGSIELDNYSLGAKLF